MFRTYLAEHPELIAAARGELRGKTLMCWCKLDGRATPTSCSSWPTNDPARVFQDQPPDVVNPVFDEAGAIQLQRVAAARSGI